MSAIISQSRELSTPSSQSFQSAILNEKAAAAYCGIGAQTLRRARMVGVRVRHLDSPPFLKLGRSVRYLKIDLDQWIASHRVIPGAKR